MNYDQMLDQLENHVLTLIRERGSDDVSCDACYDGDHADECQSTSEEAINLALIVLRRARGSVSVPEMMVDQPATTCSLCKRSWTYYTGEWDGRGCDDEWHNRGARPLS